MVENHFSRKKTREAQTLIQNPNFHGNGADGGGQFLLVNGDALQQNNGRPASTAESDEEESGPESPLSANRYSDGRQTPVCSKIGTLKRKGPILDQEDEVDDDERERKVARIGMKESGEEDGKSSKGKEFSIMENI
jgi:hypothetical protein